MLGARDERGGVALWDGTSAPQRLAEGVWHLCAGRGRRSAWIRPEPDALVLVDAACRSVIEVEAPTGGRWELVGSFSPAGDSLALGVEASARGVDRGRPHRLAVVDVSDGSVALAQSEYDNFARPVWSADGAWIVFNAPFEPGGLWLCAVAGPKLERIPFESDPPVPLLDVSPFVA